MRESAETASVLEDKEVKRSPLPRPTKPVRKKRAGPPRRTSCVRDQAYKDWLKCLSCLACDSLGIPMRRRTGFYRIIDPAHTRNGGGSMKGDDSSCVPLCRLHHDAYDTAAPKSAWAYAYGLDMEKISAELYAKFKGEKNA